MIRTLIMIVCLWGLEIGLIIHSNNQNAPLPNNWLISSSLINLATTLFLVITEIAVLHGQ